MKFKFKNLKDAVTSIGKTLSVKKKNGGLIVGFKLNEIGQKIFKKKDPKK